MRLPLSSTLLNRSTGSASPLLPLATEPEKPKPSPPPWSPSSIRSPRQRRRCFLVLGVIAVILFLFRSSLNTAWRDFGYLIRPLWDTPTPPGKWDVIGHYSNPHPDSSSSNEAWCNLHGWQARKTATRPTIIDAVPVSSELDLIELRMIEGAGIVDTLVVIESNMTYAGTPKPLWFADKRARFDALSRKTGIRLVYVEVDTSDFTPNLEKGSFHNEGIQRRAINDALTQERINGHIPDGSLIIMADTDEIISRETLELLAACDIPDIMHLRLKNYRYSFNLFLADEGNWVPKVMRILPGSGDYVAYNHRHTRDGPLLENSGWHCTFCFPTLEEIRSKMKGYSHNDRLSSLSLLGERTLRKKVCTGQDPFGMWPEAFSFRDLIIESFDTRPLQSFDHLPLGLKQYPGRFPYLVNKGCERPNK